jgi:hypothetical protein
MDDFRIYNRILDATEIGTLYSSDALVDPTALKVRYNFGSAGVGSNLNWPVGALQSSPTLGPGNWTPVSNVELAAPFLAPGTGLPATTNSTLFYRVGF